MYCPKQTFDVASQYSASGQLAEPVPDPVQRIDLAEAFFAATGTDIRHGGNQAYYTVGADYIQMPPFEAFRDAESYSLQDADAEIVAA